ncbi:MAG: hypothetical protein ACAI38_03295 [Myxococcota bacterium]
MAKPPDRPPRNPWEAPPPLQGRQTGEHGVERTVISRPPPPPTDSEDAPSRDVTIAEPFQVAETYVGQAPVAETHVGPWPVAATHVGPKPGAVTQVGSVSVGAGARMIGVANLPTAPLLRSDLTIVKETADTVSVRRAGTATAFPIYRVEWRIAQLMDGHRSLTAIAQRAQQLGLQATPELVRSFMRELRGYGFLADDSSGAPEKSADLRAALAAADSEEERHLLRSALTVERAGNDQGVAGYLEAALEINPDNEQARVALERRPRAPRAESIAFDIDELEPEAQAPEPRPTKIDPIIPTVAPSGHRRIVFVAAAIVVAVSAAAAAIVIRAEQRVAAQLAGLEKQAGAPVVPQVAPPSAQPRANPTVVVQARFEPSEGGTVTAPSAGTWARVDVAVRDRVSAGAVVGALLDAKSYAKLSRAQKRYESIQKSARYDEVYRYFLAQARDAYERTARTVRWVEVTAEAAGEIASLVEVGTTVEANQAVATLASRAKLTTRVPAGAVSFPAATATCTLVDNPSLACAIRGDGESLVVTVDDPEGLLQPDSLVAVKVADSAP